MNKLFQKLFPKLWLSSPDYRKQEAAKWDNKLLKYITERFPEGDKVIGKDGYICVKSGYVFVNTETESIFKCPDTDVECGELMSRDGVILSGFDMIKERERSIICYFKYYR